MLIEGHILNGKIADLLNYTYPYEAQRLVRQYAEYCGTFWYILLVLEQKLKFKSWNNIFHIIAFGFTRPKVHGVRQGSEHNVFL